MPHWLVEVLNLFQPLEFIQRSSESFKVLQLPVLPRPAPAAVEVNQYYLVLIVNKNVVCVQVTMVNTDLMYLSDDIASLVPDIFVERAAGQGLSQSPAVRV